MKELANSLDTSRDRGEYDTMAIQWFDSEGTRKKKAKLTHPPSPSSCGCAHFSSIASQQNHCNTLAHASVSPSTQHASCF